MSDRPSPVTSPPLVALAAWLVPGGGYFLLGQRARGLTVGVTVVALFVFGLLIGGVRALEVRAKPWSIAQFLTGPVAIGGAAWSIWAATDPDGDDGDLEPPGALSHARV